MPVYLKNRIYTMPQFLNQRYNSTVAMIMAVFWLLLYVIVNLTSILYLGAIAISGLIGPEYLHTVMIALAVFSLIITLGGMKVIGYTDVIQVAVLIIGGFATIYFALTIVSEKFGLGRDAMAGFKTLMDQAPDHCRRPLCRPPVQPRKPARQAQERACIGQHRQRAPRPAPRDNGLGTIADHQRIVHRVHTTGMAQVLQVRPDHQCRLPCRLCTGIQRPHPLWRGEELSDQVFPEPAPGESGHGRACQRPVPRLHPFGIPRRQRNARKRVNHAVLAVDGCRRGGAHRLGPAALGPRRGSRLRNAGVV